MGGMGWVLSGAWLLWPTRVALLNWRWGLGSKCHSNLCLSTEKGHYLLLASTVCQASCKGLFIHRITDSTETP
jgi:hypothetical protein